MALLVVGTVHAVRASMGTAEGVTWRAATPAGQTPSRIATEAPRRPQSCQEGTEDNHQTATR